MSLSVASNSGPGVVPRTAAQPAAGGGQPHALLVARLGAALGAEPVRYCQWKGHAKKARWSTGEGDVDLLVDRRDAAMFAGVLGRLGFKLALARGGAQAPGMLSYLGLDPALRRLIHVHVHFQLALGRPWARHYHLPLEAPVLDSAIQRTWFKTPSPDLELLLLVLHSTLRHRSRDLAAAEEPYWIRSVQQGLQDLEAETDRTAIARALERHVPHVDLPFFERCRATLRPGCSTWRRMTARLALERRLSAYARRPPSGARLRHALDLARRLAGLHEGPERSGRHLATGGALIGLIGADGSGKSTCAEDLERWLAPEINTRRVHLGRPPRSLLTLVVGAALKIVRRLDMRGARPAPSNAASLLELARYVCTARDRYRLYRRMRRFAARGGIAICDRFPIPESYALAGPSSAQGVATAARGTLAQMLRQIEADYYARIATPDVALVLRIDPEGAVQRKTDEPEAYVRQRARLLMDVDWSQRPARLVIDAARPLADVVTTVRSRLWEAL